MAREARWKYFRWKRQFWHKEERDKMQVIKQTRAKTVPVVPSPEVILTMFFPGIIKGSRGQSQQDYFCRIYWGKWYYMSPFRKLRTRNNCYISGILHKMRNIYMFCLSLKIEGAAAYQLGNTSSCMITEVEQHWARTVLGGETLVQVLPECCW